MREGARKPAQITRDRLRISGLYLKGWLQVEIAEEVGLHQSTVSRDLKALQKQWQHSALVNVDEAKAKELARVDHLEREYWEAWERSVGEYRTKKTEDINGDPRYLSGVQWCINKRCELLGLDAPSKHEIGPLTLNVVYDDEPDRQTEEAT